MPDLYLERHHVGPDGISDLWSVEEGHAQSLITGQEIALPPGPVLSALGGAFSPFLQREFTLCDGTPGVYFRRIYRPTIAWDFIGYPPIDEAFSATGLEQLEALTDELFRIFRTVQPQPQNLETFGHTIRNLLIIACTEVEAQLRGVLVANNMKPQNKKVFTTTDYVKVLPHLRLAEYEVAIPSRPHLPACVPFEGWSASNPTQSLEWYSAYNEVKHDRETKFRLASLQNAISAVAACHIIHAAQYGGHRESRWTVNKFTHIRFTCEPVWSDEAKYIPPAQVPTPQPWVAVDYQF